MNVFMAPLFFGPLTIGYRTALCLQFLNKLC